MINAIAELGEYVLKQNPDLSILDIFLEDAYDGGKNKHLFVIVLKEINGKEKWKFDRIDYFELDSTYKKKILYKKGNSGRGPDYTPTTKITELEKKTFPNKIINWFKAQKDNEIFSDKEKTFLNELYKVIKEKQQDIINEINKKFLEIEDKITDKSGSVLTIGFKNSSSKVDFINSYILFEKVLVEEAKKSYKYSPTHKVYSFSRDKLCSVCNKNVSEVMGFFTDLKFYNIDKPGMITGGLRYENAWKNYPVCLDCALKVRKGFDVLQNKFSFRFYGLRYYFTPKISNKDIYSNILDALLNFKDNPTFKKEDINRLTNDENELFEFIQEKETNFSFDLFFYDKPQKSVLRILMLIEDVLPSRLQKLFNLKKKIDKIIFFQDARSKKGELLCYFNFRIVRNFFSNSTLDGNKDKSFLEVTEKIFKGKPVNYKFIMHSIMDKIKSKFARRESTWLDSLKGFMLVLYLLKLRIINIEKNGEVTMNEQFFKNFEIRTKEELEDKVRLFFSSFEDFFQTDIHRSIFLLGVLSQFLLAFQQSQGRENPPFRSKLKGLKMTAYDLSVLLPAIIEKLEQYRKNFYRPLEELTSKYLISAENYKNWRLPVDEMNFIFVLGMNLSKYFKIKSEEKKEEQNG
jgi:CRISPR-associated protein Csh1